jgi:transposase
VHLPRAQIVYDKFHLLKHANAAVDETRRAEFFRKGGRLRGLVRGKRWLLLTRWHHLDRDQRQTLTALFAVTRRLAKAYLFRDHLTQLWTYTYEANARRFLTTWCLALQWQRLPAFERLATLLLTHLDGILAYCHVKVALRRRGGHQREHPRRPPPGPRLPGSCLLAPQGAAGDG